MLERKDWDTWSECTWSLFSKFSVEWNWIPLPRPPLTGQWRTSWHMSVYLPHFLVGWHLHLLYLRAAHTPCLGSQMLVDTPLVLPGFLWGSAVGLCSFCAQELSVSQQVSFHLAWRFSFAGRDLGFPVFLLKMRQTALQLFANSLMSKVANFGLATSPHTYPSPTHHLFQDCCL